MKAKNISCALAALFLSGLITVRAADLPTTSVATATPAASVLGSTATINQLLSRVSAASAADRPAAISAALQTVAREQANLLPDVVSAISSRFAPLAPVAATKGMLFQPDQAAKIITAAIQAAPAQAGAIVESVLYFNPAACSTVGDAALAAAPTQIREILQAVALNAATLKPYIDQALASQSVNTVAEAQSVLRQATLASRGTLKLPPANLTGVQVAASTTAAKGSLTPSPTLGALSANAAQSPAFMPSANFAPLTVPLPSAPINAGASETDAQPPGGRNYARP